MPEVAARAVQQAIQQEPQQEQGKRRDRSQLQGRPFELEAPYTPSGDQPQAIAKLAEGLDDGLVHQVMLGVTGSGKTYTLASLVEKTQRPAIVLAPNRTLAAQLYGEFREFFPRNAVEYFVSYYDYYQPEAYVAASDTYIEKDATINDHIEQMRLSATKSLLERKDVLVVCTVSAIYGLGDPDQYMSMMLHLERGDIASQRSIIRRLASLQYTRNDMELRRGTYRVRGEVIDIFPAESSRDAVRIHLFDDEVEQLEHFDPLTNKAVGETPRITIYPKTHYATPEDTVAAAVEQIQQELEERVMWLKARNYLVEAQRLEQRTRYDLAMLSEVGFCNGIENYARYFTGRPPGEPPVTLMEYVPEDALLVVDESHVSLPQLGAMYKGDRSRKQNLVDYGFRLPSALDNRPLRFEEWEAFVRQRIYVSATPADWENEHSDQTVELLVRPTGIVDPQVEVRPVTTQVDDLMGECTLRAERNERVLVTTLTKRMAEDLTDYLVEHGLKVRYLHSDIDTVERVEILRDLRLGVFDVLVGINLLREGLDLPEVSLVAILDADKEGFLRSTRSLIQTMGRAARNVEGRVILYADSITDSMRRAIDETDRRRARQQEHNEAHGITPHSLGKDIGELIELGDVAASASGERGGGSSYKRTRGKTRKQRAGGSGAGSLAGGVAGMAGAMGGAGAQNAAAGANAQGAAHGSAAAGSGASRGDGNVFGGDLTAADMEDAELPGGAEMAAHIAAGANVPRAILLRQLEEMGINVLGMDAKAVAKAINDCEKRMHHYADQLEFEEAASCRDKADLLRQVLVEV